MTSDLDEECVMRLHLATGRCMTTVHCSFKVEIVMLLLLISYMICHMFKKKPNKQKKNPHETNFKKESKKRFALGCFQSGLVTSFSLSTQRLYLIKEIHSHQKPSHGTASHSYLHSLNIHNFSTSKIHKGSTNNLSKLCQHWV